MFLCNFVVPVQLFLFINATANAIRNVMGCCPPIYLGAKAAFFLNFAFGWLKRLVGIFMHWLNTNHNENVPKLLITILELLITYLFWLQHSNWLHCCRSTMDDFQVEASIHFSCRGSGTFQLSSTTITVLHREMVKIYIRYTVRNVSCHLSYSQKLTADVFRIYFLKKFKN